MTLNRSRNRIGVISVFCMKTYYIQLYPLQFPLLNAPLFQIFYTYKYSTLFYRLQLPRLTTLYFKIFCTYKYTTLFYPLQVHLLNTTSNRFRHLLHIHSSVWYIASNWTESDARRYDLEQGPVLSSPVSAMRFQAISRRASEARGENRVKFLGKHWIEYRNIERLAHIPTEILRVHD